MSAPIATSTDASSLLVDMVSEEVEAHANAPAPGGSAKAATESVGTAKAEEIGGPISNKIQNIALSQQLPAHFEGLRDNADRHQGGDVVAQQLLDRRAQLAKKVGG